MAYIAGHHAFVAYAPEVGSITESANGTTPAALPAVPTSINLIGYTNVPEQRLALNNGWGYGVGTAYGQYRKRGAVTPSLSITLRAGSLDLLESINRTDDVLPSLAFFVGVPGVWTDVYRFSKINTLSLSARESSAEASEIESTLQIEATAVQTLATPLNPDTSLILALGDPLFWHDARVANVENSAVALVDLRASLMSFEVSIGHNLERKNTRPNWGDNVPLSRTSYALLEHLITVSGTLSLHDRLPASLTRATANAQEWGDFTLGISNVGGTKAINLVLNDLMPTELSSQGVEASAQQSHSVSYTARNYTLATTS